MQTIIAIVVSCLRNGGINRDLTRNYRSAKIQRDGTNRGTVYKITKWLVQGLKIGTSPEHDHNSGNYEYKQNRRLNLDCGKLTRRRGKEPDLSTKKACNHHWAQDIALTH